MSQCSLLHNCRGYSEQILLMSRICRKWTLERCRPSIETTLSTMSLVHWSVAYVEWSDPDIVCVIGHGKHSNRVPEMWSTIIKIFSPHMWLGCHMLLRPMVKFSKAIYILYRYHKIFALKSRTSASFSQFQTLIVAIS